MTTTISGTSGVTYPAGGTDNVAGSGVGTTDTQTLTNKTLTSPTMTGAVVSSMASSVITSGTAVASTSGTSIDFTSIPSWVKRITVMFNGVSTNGASPIQVQIGAGSITSSGYNSGSYTNAVKAVSTTGFQTDNGGAIFTRSGLMTISTLGSNIWVASGSWACQPDSDISYFAGGVTLGGTLDRVRITTVNGTDTFDAGSINILYE